MLFGFGEKVEEAKKAVKEASQTKDDPAERVTPEGAATTNEGQQTNAENVRREAENASPPGGDARSPTGSQSAVANFNFDTAGLQKNVRSVMIWLSLGDSLELCIVQPHHAPSI